jgi:hypothetical protein
MKDFQLLDDKGNVIGTKQFTPSQFERALQAQGSTVKKMVNNPTMDIDKLHVEAKIQKALRETQDALMEKVDGPEYRTFKDNYAATRQLEADIIQRARVTTRQGPYSLIDFADVYSLPEIVGGVLTGNPMMVGRGLLTKGAQKYIKWANHPDTAIKNMFTTVDKLMDRKAAIAGPYGSKSRTGQMVEDALGMRNPIDLTVPHTEQLGVPLRGGLRDVTPSSNRVPAILQQPGLPVPTGISRNISPTTNALAMPSDASMLLRHPMGEMGLVPTGIKQNYPTGVAADSFRGYPEVTPSRNAPMPGEGIPMGPSPSAPTAPIRTGTPFAPSEGTPNAALLQEIERRKEAFRFQKLQKTPPFLWTADDKAFLSRYAEGTGKPTGIVGAGHPQGTVREPIKPTTLTEGQTRPTEATAKAKTIVDNIVQGKPRVKRRKMGKEEE